MLFALACGKLLIQFAGINHYGFFRDELYYIACGQHLAWGYVDQPPLIAFVAWFARHALGTSLFATRLIPVLAGAVVVYATGRIAAELGGGLFAQFLAAIAILLAPSYLAFDAFLSMNAFEPLFWLLCAWIAIRIVKGASPRLWLLFGVVAGLGLENKHSMLVFGFALVVGLLLSGQARLFRSPWIWIGAAVALAIFLPNLLWEARNGWPQVEVVRNAQQFKNEAISPQQFLFEQVLFLQPLALPVWLSGLWWYFAALEGKRFRFLGWAYLFVLAIFIVLGGKSYYALPVYPVLMAAGGVALEGFLCRTRAPLDGCGVSGAADRRGHGDAPVWCADLAGQYLSALYEAAAVREFGEDGARLDGRAAATLRGHVRLGKYGHAGCQRVSRTAAVRTGWLRDSGGKLRRGGRD